MLKIKIFFMRKISLVMLWLAAFQLLACNNKQPQQSANTDQQPVLKDTLPNASWSVKGCAEKATRSDTKFPASGEYKDETDASPAGDTGINADGDSIVYNRFEQHLCCRQVKVSVDKKGNEITVTEYWFGQGCKCRCSSTVHAVIRELPKGKYEVYGIATGTDPVENKPTGIKDTVLAKKVTIQ
jgi:hypothetical protein